MSRDAYFKRVHGAPTVGRPDGLFITTKGKMDQILAEAGGNLSKIEQKLGFDPGYFSNGNGLVRVDIADPLAHNARLPSGFEAGANEHFVWGGYTSGGVPEAVVNPVPVSQTAVTFL